MNLIASVEKASSSSHDRSDSAQQREQLLEAVAYSAKELLSTRDWHSKIDEILRKLGTASDSSRVYVFQHEQDFNGGLLTSLVFEWCAPGISLQIDNPELKKMEIGAVGFQRWIDLMSSGKLVSGTAESFPDDERELLEAQSIKAFAVIPFFVSGKWWGFIGFDQCDRIRGWSPAELGALQAAANMIGSAIERQVAEDRLHSQFTELQKTNLELDFFVYSVSHDLRAPLTSILGLINIAEKENISNNQLEYLRMIRSSVHKMDGFIKEILDYSRNTRTEIDSEDVDFNVLLAEVFLRVMPPDIRTLFQIEYTIEGDEPFYSDKKRLEVILNNLVSNAVKFREVSKTSSRITITIRISSKEAEIIVEDDGIGIEEIHLDKIFNMFYRGTEKATGSGLGLYITKEVIAKLSGKIEVTSTVGEFTRFKLLLPNLQTKVLSNT
ncbi:MAG: GAF domain-containing sensor histidine kinase [Cyclobacteriaceae bacterium]|nr:GAF domain-containing sensor histidine kinase [Cyclobacteriaceae bacterium]